MIHYFLTYIYVIKIREVRHMIDIKEGLAKKAKEAIAKKIK